MTRLAARSFAIAAVGGGLLVAATIASSATRAGDGDGEPGGPRAAAIDVALELPDDLPPLAGPSHGFVFLVREDVDRATAAAEAAARAPRAERFRRLGQSELRFHPKVVGLVLGESLVIGNDDPEVHSVHCRALRTPFNLTVKPGDRREQSFGAVGAHEILCDIHAQMRALVLVVPDPWLERIGTGGRARLAPVPPGRYRLQLFHEWLVPEGVEDDEAGPDEPGAPDGRRPSRRPAPGVTIGRIVVDAAGAASPPSVAVTVRVRAAPPPRGDGAPVRPDPPSRRAERSIAGLRAALADARAGRAERARRILDQVLHGHYGGPIGLEAHLRRELPRARVAELGERIEAAAAAVNRLLASPSDDVAATRAAAAVDEATAGIAAAIAATEREDR